MQLHANATAAPRKLNRSESLAVIRYLASGGTVHTYAPGLRALPPNADSLIRGGKPIPFYCVHAPLPSHTH